MSYLQQCDGPNCSNSRPINAFGNELEISSRAWITVKKNFDIDTNTDEIIPDTNIELEFCSIVCLVEKGEELIQEGEDDD